MNVAIQPCWRKSKLYQNMKKLLFPTHTAQGRGWWWCVCLSETKTELHRTYKGKLDFTLWIYKDFTWCLIYNAHYVVHSLFLILFLLKEKYRSLWTNFVDHEVPMIICHTALWNILTQLPKLNQWVYLSLHNFHTVITEFPFYRLYSHISYNQFFQAWYAMLIWVL